jgi:hydrogenase maturation protease
VTVLVVGYGNSLRGDDGVGWHVAGLLAADPRLAGAEVLVRHQLTPELAADVARVSLVVLVDASAGGAPGSILMRLVRPRPPAPATWSHQLDPESLVGLAEALYGGAPPVVLVGVAAGSFDGGDRLSAALERVLPDVVEVVAEVVSGAGPASGPRPTWRSGAGGSRRSSPR